MTRTGQGHYLICLLLDPGPVSRETAAGGGGGANPFNLPAGDPRPAGSADGVGSAEPAEITLFRDAVIGGGGAAGAPGAGAEGGGGGGAWEGTCGCLAAGEGPGGGGGGASVTDRDLGLAGGGGVA